MPKYYTREEVAGVASVETLGNGIESTAEEPKRIVALWVKEKTATENRDAYIRGYIDRERILDMKIINFLAAFDSDTQIGQYARIEIDHEIPVGRRFKAGHLSGATASDIEYTYEYEII